jgi:hypothetical protein
MMKKGSTWGTTKIAGILLVLLFLVIIFFAISSSYGGVKEIIKSFLGEKTELEVTHEQNEMATNAFKNLENQIKKCKNFKEDNCGCLVDLNKFSNSHKIEFTDNEIKLLSIKNLGDSGVQMASFNAELNCYWDNNLEEKPLKEMQIAEDRPSIFESVAIWTSITNRGNRYYFTYKYNLLKNNGRLCWLTNKVKEDKIKDLKECQ